MEGFVEDVGNEPLIALQMLKAQCPHSALYGAKDESEIGKQWLIVPCYVTPMCTCGFWDTLKMGKRRVALLWRKKTQVSPLYQF